MRDDSSFSSWTVPSTIATESMVQVPPPSSSSTTGFCDDTNCLDLTVLARYDSVGMESHQVTTQICANIKAVDAFGDDMDNDSRRAPVDIVVALDVSSSMMADNKITDCKRTLEMIVRTVKSTDRFGLVTYSDQAWIKFPVCVMTQLNKDRALETIKSIRAYGNTNLSGGLTLAAVEMSIIQDPNGVQSILLLTDGYANAGITTTEDLRNMVKEITRRDKTRIHPLPNDGTGTLSMEDDDTSVGSFSLGTKSGNSKPPMSLICFGYGSQHNSEMLEAIANETPGGAYYFVENGSDTNISSALGDALGGLLSVVAQSAVLTISLPPHAIKMGIKILKVHHDEAIERSEGSCFTVHVGDFYSEESRDVLFEVQLSNQPSEGPVSHAIVSLSYMDTIRGKSCSRGPIQCMIGRPSPSDVVSPANSHVETQWLRIWTVQQILEARREADGNNLAAARARLQGSVQHLRDPSLPVDVFHATMMARDLEEVHKSLSSPDVYRSEGRHRLVNKYYEHRKQRCMDSTMMQRQASYEMEELYSTKKKVVTRAKFNEEK